MLKLTITLDGATSRLIAITNAAVLSDVLPKETAKRLHSQARAARLALTAGEAGVARSFLEQFAPALEGAEGQQVDVAQAIVRHVGAVLKAISFETRS